MPRFKRQRLSRNLVFAKGFRRQGPLVPIIAGAGVLLLVVLAVFPKPGAASWGARGLGYVTGALQSGTTHLRQWADGLFAEKEDLQTALNQSAHLQQQMDAMAIELEALREAARETVFLKQQLGYAEAYPYWDLGYARVIARDQNAWMQTLVLDKGERDGIKVDMVVLTSAGVVGRIVEVMATTSKVEAIIDARSAIGAVCERTRDLSIAKGTLSGQDLSSPRLMLTLLAHDHSLYPGDVVRSSGLDGVYPAGLSIGVVEQVSRQSSVRSEVVVLPSVDFEHLEAVLVLKGTLDEPRSYEVQPPAQGDLVP